MQGPGGAKAEGRMPYVGMIYNPDPRRPDDPDDDGLADDARNQGKGKSKGKGTSTGKSRNQNQGIDQRRRPDGQVRYLAGLMGLPALGQALRAQARQVGVAAADVIVALTDGAPCLAELFRTNFPLAILILDFWHAAEHLADFSKLLHPHDPAAAAAWFQELRHALRHEGGLPVLGRLLNLDMQHHAEAAREAHRLLLGYLDGNVYRMDYPAYRAKGWRIGSGPVEAACKSVVNARLCLVGMRWREPGADGLCHLRALYRSELSQWADYWNPPVAAVAA